MSSCSRQPSAAWHVTFHCGYSECEALSDISKVNLGFRLQNSNIRLGILLKKFTRSCTKQTHLISMSNPVGDSPVWASSKRSFSANHWA